MRYFQPKEYQYVSQYTPEMAAMDYQKGQDLIKQEEAFNKDLNDLKSKYTLSKGQYASQGLVDKANNTIQTNLNQVTQDLYNNKIGVREANSKLATIANYFNTDPFIQGIKADKELTEKEKAQVASGKLNPKSSLNTYGAPIWSMDEKRRVKEIDDPQELVNKLPFLYNTLDKGDPIKVAQGALKGILEKDGETTIDPNKDYRFQLKDDPKNPDNKILIGIDEGGQEVSTAGISPEKIEGAIRDLVKSNRNNPDQFWEWHNRNQSTDEDIVNELMGSYPASFKLYSKKAGDKKYNFIDEGSSKTGKGKSNEDNLKELAKTTITTVGNTINFNDADGKAIAISNPIELKKQVVQNKIKLDESTNKAVQSLNSTYGQGLFTINTDDNNHPYIEVDESKVPLDKKAAILNEVITKNKQLKQQQIQQINNENILIRVEDAMRADAEALGKTFKLENIKITPDEKVEAINTALRNYGNLTGVPTPTLNVKDDVDKFLKKYKDQVLIDFYNNALGVVNPEYAKYNKLLNDQLKGVQYKDQLLLTLDDKPESQSLKQVMQRTLDDKGLRNKLIKDVTVNQNVARPNDINNFWSDYDSDPEYKKLVEKAVQNGFARFDENTGKWATHITVPNKDASKGNFELTFNMDETNQPMLQKYGRDHGYDYNFIAMTKRKDWIDSFTGNEAGYGLLKSNKFVDVNKDENPDLVLDAKGNPVIDQRTGEIMVQPSQGLDIITQRITVPRSYKDTYGNLQKLQVGETIFDLPGITGIIFKANDTNGLFKFHALLDAAKASGDENLWNQTLNSASTFGVDLINNTALYNDYNRQRRLTLDENSFKPSNTNQIQTTNTTDTKKQQALKEAQDQVNKWKTIIKRKQETGRSGSVYTDKELQEKLTAAQQKLEKLKSGK